jgi:energy-coupling factor transport system permease protein
VIVFFIFTVLQVWDGRVVFALLLVSIGYYRLANIPWRQIRRNWTIVFVFIGLLVTVNSIVSGGDVSGMPSGDLHVLFTMPIFGTPISAESLSWSVTLLMRYLAMATIGFPLAFAVAPADFGVAFHRLGVPEKFAYGIDLTFRFLPSLAADLQTTADAQRIRGFNWSDGAAGFLGKVRNSVPVVVPTVVNAIAGAEDTIDAMDLRGFGTSRRTWLRHLAYERLDWLVIAFFAGLLVVFTILGFRGITSVLWTPPFLIDLASN